MGTGTWSGRFGFGLVMVAILCIHYGALAQLSNMGAPTPGPPPPAPLIPPQITNPNEYRSPDGNADVGPEWPEWPEWPDSKVMIQSQVHTLPSSARSVHHIQQLDVPPSLLNPSSPSPGPGGGIPPSVSPIPPPPASSPLSPTIGPLPPTTSPVAPPVVNPLPPGTPLPPPMPGAQPPSAPVSMPSVPLVAPPVPLPPVPPIIPPPLPPPKLVKLMNQLFKNLPPLYSPVIPSPSMASQPMPAPPIPPPKRMVNSIKLLLPPPLFSPVLPSPPTPPISPIPPVPPPIPSFVEPVKMALPPPLFSLIPPSPSTPSSPPPSGPMPPQPGPVPPVAPPIPPSKLVEKIVVPTPFLSPTSSPTSNPIPPMPPVGPPPLPVAPPIPSPKLIQSRKQAIPPFVPSPSNPLVSAPCAPTQPFAPPPQPHVVLSPISLGPIPFEFHHVLNSEDDKLGRIRGRSDEKNNANRIKGKPPPSIPSSPPILPPSPWLPLFSASPPSSFSYPLTSPQVSPIPNSRLVPPTTPPSSFSSPSLSPEISSTIPTPPPTSSLLSPIHSGPIPSLKSNRDDKAGKERGRSEKIGGRNENPGRSNKHPERGRGNGKSSFSSSSPQASPPTSSVSPPPPSPPSSVPPSISSSLPPTSSKLPPPPPQMSTPSPSLAPSIFLQPPISAPSSFSPSISPQIPTPSSISSSSPPSTSSPSISISSSPSTSSTPSSMSPFSSPTPSSPPSSGSSPPPSSTPTSPQSSSISSPTSSSAIASPTPSSSPLLSSSSSSPSSSPSPTPSNSLSISQDVLVAPITRIPANTNINTDSSPVFVVTLMMGTPPRPINLTIDTAEDQIVIPKSKCNQIASPMPCSHPLCTSKACNSGGICIGRFLEKTNPSISSIGMNCSGHMQDGAKLVGSIAVGCLRRWRGDIGVAGLSSAPSSLPSQVSTLASLPSKFSYCLGKPNGFLFIGCTDLVFGGNYTTNTTDGMTWIPIIDDMFLRSKLMHIHHQVHALVDTNRTQYLLPALALTGIGIGNSTNDAGGIIRLSVDPNVFQGGAILSTGIRYMQLVDAAYQELQQKVIDGATNMGLEIVKDSPFPELDVCFKLKPGQCISRAPRLWLMFKDDVSWALDPHNYLVRWEDTDVVCLGIVSANRDKVSVLGTLQQEELVVKYDLESQRVGVSVSLQRKGSECSQFIPPSQVGSIHI